MPKAYNPPTTRELFFVCCFFVGSVLFSRVLYETNIGLNVICYLNVDGVAVNGKLIILSVNKQSEIGLFNKI